MISKHRELQMRCKQLPFTREKSLSCMIVESTKSELDNLYREYDYATVLGELSSVWTYVDATLFFGEMNEFTKSKRQIKTIATAYYRANLGGVQRVNAELMNIWVKMGLNVVFFTEEPANPLDFVYPKSVKRIIIPKKTDMKARLSALQKYCLEENVDLYINHEWSQPTFIWECILMKKLNIYFIQYCHAHFASCFKRGGNYLFQPESFKLCSLVIAISETNARFYQLCGCRTYLVQNPVPSDLKYLTNRAKLDSNRVLMVGRLANDKNPLDSIEIFKRAHAKLPTIVLDVVGDGVLAESMRIAVRQQGLEKSIIFHGAKTTGELDSYYSNAACVLFTSQMEGYPMMILEAKAYGLPLVMYELPYLSLIKDGKGILSVSIGDIDGMAGHLIKVMEDYNYRKTLGSDARISFDLLNSHNYISDWEEIFEIVYNDNIHQSANFYSPEKLNNSERFILPMLLDELKKLVAVNRLEDNIYYRTGRIVLKIPKAVYSVLKQLKRSIMR